MRFTVYHLLLFSFLASLCLQLLVYEDVGEVMCSACSGVLKRTAGIVHVANVGI